MKKKSRITIKILTGLVSAILILLFMIPVLFKEKIKTSIEQSINESVNAKISFSDYKLGFFRNFPNLTFSLDGVSISGTGKFENDTLASFKSLNLVFNLSSLFGKSGYEIRSATINEAAVNALVLEDGSENWNIMKESGDTSAEDESSSQMKILLKKVEILNSRIAYIDRSSAIETYLDDVGFNIKGDMTLNEANLGIMIKAGELTYIMDGMKYLNKVTAEANINVLAKTDSMKFYLMENYLLINDLKLNFAGYVAMPADDIETDLTFSTGQASLKSLMSLIPSVYMSDYKDLKTSGNISLSGSARGVYSDADSTMPDISLNAFVNDGIISYPSLPEQIKNINLKSEIFVNGKVMDKTTIDVDKFHMELAGNPFDLNFSLKTPISDPDFSASMTGKIDLDALSKAIPMDSIGLSGVVKMSVNMAGKMSMIEKQQYDRFIASGNMSFTDMMVAMSGYPAVNIKDAMFEFSPAFASLRQSELKIGEKSDFSVNGNIENYLPYIFNDGVIKGGLSLHSDFIDLNEIMASLSDTTVVEDTTALSVVKIPENIDFDFKALVDRFSYKNIKAGNLKGHIIVKDGILSFKETGMNILGGALVMNADYDTRDSLKPSVKAELALESLGVKDAFSTFNTVKKLAPASKGIDGKVGIKLSYSSLFGKDFMPVIATIRGGGKLQSNEISLVESSVYKKVKELLKLGENYSNTFRDINISFKINDGKIYVSPFNTRVGNLKMNISGEQGIDQTINYVIKTEMPRSDLGSQVNSLIDNLSAQAASFGISFKPAEIIRVNLKVSGTFLKPVINPFFGNSPTDSSSAANSAVRQIVDNKTEEVKKEIKSEALIQADKIIKEAEEKGQIIREEAAEAADKIRKEADLQAQRVVREAESKGTLAKITAQKGAESLKREADKRAAQIVKEADDSAIRLVDEAKIKRDELLK